MKRLTLSFILSAIAAFATIAQNNIAEEEVIEEKEAVAEPSKEEELLKQLDEKNDQLLRTLAEYDNFRKRSAKEREGVYADAVSDTLSSILPVLDNLERAGKSDNFEAVAKGLELTVKAFDDALQKMGVTEIETKTFDPNLHNAVMHIESEEVGENTITMVFQKGFKQGDKVIRFAMVQVAN